MRRTILGVVLIAAMSVSVCLVVDGPEKTPLETVSAFLNAARRGDLAAAEGLLSEELLACTSREGLQMFLAQSGLSDSAVARWERWVTQMDRVILEGSIQTRSGLNTLCRFELVAGEGCWRIASIEQPDRQDRLSLREEDLGSGERLAERSDDDR